MPEKWTGQCSGCEHRDDAHIVTGFGPRGLLMIECVSCDCSFTARKSRKGELHPMRTFKMYRRNREAVVAMHRTDAASVAADEVTVEGVVFEDGKVAVRWLTPNRSSVVWDSLADFEAVHVTNHPDYGTDLVWGPDEQTINDLLARAMPESWENNFKAGYLAALRDALDRNAESGKEES